MNDTRPTYIYFLYDPTWQSQSFYVGKTVDPKARLRGHLSKRSLKKHTKKNNYLKKMIKQGIKPAIHVICEIPDYMTWQEAEIEWIAFLKWCHVSLKNSTPGEISTRDVEPQIWNDLPIVKINRPPTKIEAV